MDSVLAVDFSAETGFPVRRGARYSPRAEQSCGP